ncbi:MAG: DALR anticodon-binding domain-containing protein, partial [Cyclobacteriaceae bacterium]
AILRRAETLQISPEIGTTLALHAKESELIYRLSLFPDVIANAAKEYSPALIAQYVFDVAKDYNGFYQEVSIFGEDDKDLVKMRIALSASTAKVIKKSMELLGINVPERM